MNLWIDNTSLHSAGRCLEGRAQTESDIKDLLQLGINLVYSERLHMNGFACDAVAERTQQVLELLKRGGLTQEVLQFTSPDPARFKSICDKAAEMARTDMPMNFAIAKAEPVRGIAPDIGKRIGDQYTKDVYRVVARKLSVDQRDQIAQEALQDKAGGAVVYMLAANPALWEEARRRLGHLDARRLEPWEELIGYLRYYLNLSLARQDVEGIRAIYAPAVERGKMIWQASESLRQRLEDGVDRVVAKLKPSYTVGVPSLRCALVNRSRGDPLGVISEALALRDKAKGLHAWLARIAETHDFLTEGGRKEANDEIDEIITVLEMSLHVHEPPKDGAITIQINLGPFSVTFSPARIKERLMYRRHKRDVVALTEMCRAAAFPADNLSWERLKHRCTNRTTK